MSSNSLVTRGTGEVILGETSVTYKVALKENDRQKKRGLC